MVIQQISRLPVDIFIDTATLENVMPDIIDVLSSVEKETLDEVYRGVINIPYLQDGLKALIEVPENLFGF